MKKRGKTMNFHVLTLFPEMVSNGLNTSILGRATDKGLLSFDVIVSKGDQS